MEINKTKWFHRCVYKYTRRYLAMHIHMHGNITVHAKNVIVMCLKIHGYKNYDIVVYMFINGYKGEKSLQVYKF